MVQQLLGMLEGLKKQVVGYHLLQLQSIHLKTLLVLLLIVTDHRIQFGTEVRLVVRPDIVFHNMPPLAHIGFPHVILFWA